MGWCWAMQEVRLTGIYTLIAKWRYCPHEAHDIHHFPCSIAHWLDFTFFQLLVWTVYGCTQLLKPSWCEYGSSLHQLYKRYNTTLHSPASLWFFKKKSKTPVQSLKILMILNHSYKLLTKFRKLFMFCLNIVFVINMSVFKIANAVQSVKRLLSSNSKFFNRIFPSKQTPIISYWWNAFIFNTLSEKSRLAIHFHAQK